MLTPPDLEREIGLTGKFQYGNFMVDFSLLLSSLDNASVNTGLDEFISEKVQPEIYLNKKL